MRKLLSIKRLTGIVLIILSGLNVRAGGDQPVLKVLDGSTGQLKVDSTVMVEDAKFFNGAYDNVLIKPYAVKNFVSLEINEGLPVYLPGSFTATVRLRIYITHASGPIDSVDRDFTINYDTAGSYNARSTYLFNDAYRVNVKVLQLTKNVSWDVWSALKVVNQLQSFPQYQFSCSAQVIQQVNDSALAANTELDELPVWWQPVVGADQYDLEWTYVDSSALADGLYGDPQSPNALLIFENNATRVTITGSSYRIPLFYDSRGHLFYRVRAVQQQTGGGRKESFWSSQNTAGLGRFNYDGHQRNLNWEVSTSYADEGKRNTIVRYMDGTMRERQAVTKDNTTNRTLVGETMYDYQGRSVIQVLPAPTLSSVIGYTQNLNRGLNGADYDKSIYDTLPSADLYCTVQGVAMDSSSGAARYYSPANELKDSGFHKFIPDAKGYPFTETEYLQDNTGRISRKSGLGERFRIGSGHETKYYYGTPDQRELDALFGTEVGDRLHYAKNMVRDANGQYGVTYVDMHGRTIATALAGTPPDSIKLDKLPSNVASVRTEQLSDPASAVIRGLVMESKKGLLVPMAGNHTFNYRLDPRTLQLEGSNSTTFCYDCLYDLQITITDDCNNQKLGGKAFDTLVRNFSLNNIDTTCDSDSGFVVSFTKWLPEGSYEVTKKLLINQSALNYYRDTVFKKNNQVKSLETFITEQRQLVTGMLQCKPTCESCEDSVGTWEQFWLRFRERSGVGADSLDYLSQAQVAYTNSIRECKELCDSVNEATELRKNMLMDMTPSSGQYADVSNDSDLYSVFFNSQDGVLPDTAAAYTQISDYRDENGNPDLVFDEGAGKMVSPAQLSAELFVQKFKPSWAEALLARHPEYNKLTKYELLNASHAWDRRFEAVQTYAEAKKRGYLNPLDIGTSPFNLFSGTPGFIEHDPLDTFRSGIFHTKLQDSLTKFRKKDGVFVSMWGVAAAAAMCDGTDETCYNTYLNTSNAFNPAVMCVGELNMAWISYRQMYLDIKRNLVNAWIKSECPSCITPAAIITAGHQPHFSDAWEALAANDVDLPADAAGATAWQQKNQDALNEYYDANCRAYVAHWLEQLFKCTQYHPDSLNNVIIPQLIQVCKEGADADHPYGASSVKPSSSHQFRSFEEVINYYNQSHGISDLQNCHPYGITAPKPYDQQTVASNKPLMTKPAECECDNISRIYAKYQPVAALFPSFSGYMKKVYKTNVSDSVLNILLSMCEVVGGPAACKYPEAPVSLPPVFQCYTGDVCVSCEQFKLYDADYRARFPNELPSADSAANDSVQLAKNERYEQFLNYKLGFSKTVFEYLDFANACGIYYGNSLKKELEELVTDFKAYYNVLHDDYVNTYRVGGPMWRLRYHLAPDGTLNTRDDVARLVDTPGVLRAMPTDFDFTLTGEIEFYSQRNICVDNEYRWETRIRVTPGDTATTPMDDRGGRLQFATNFRSANSYFQKESFVFDILPGNGYNYYHWDTPYVYQLIQDPRIKSGFFDQWRVIKYVVTPQKFSAYYDDTLLVELDRTGMPYINDLEGVAILPFSQATRGVEIDWVRIYDKNNNLLLDESFNNGPNLAKPGIAGLCPLDCKKAFRDFYNLHFNESTERGAVDFEAVNSIYMSETGHPAPVCGADTCYPEPGYLSSYMPGGTEYLYFPHDMAATFDGGAIVAGGQAPYYLPGFNESNMAFMMRMDDRGKVLWQKNYGDSITHFKKVKPASDGGFISVGTRGANEFGTNDWKTTVMKTNKRGDVLWAKSIEGVQAVDVIQLTNTNYAVLVSGSSGCREGFAVYYYTETGNYLTHVFITTKACEDIAPPVGTVWDDVQVTALVEKRDSVLVFGTKTTRNIPGESGNSGCIYKVPQPAYNLTGPITGSYVPKVYKLGDGTQFTYAHKSNTGYLVNALYTDPVTSQEQPCIIELDSLGQVIQARKPVLTDTALTNQQLFPLKDGGFAAAWQADINHQWRKYLVTYKNGIQSRRKYTGTNGYLLGGLVRDITGNFTMLSRSPEGEDEPDDFWLTHTDSVGIVSCDSAATNITFTTITARNLTDVTASYSQIVPSVQAVRTAATQVPVADLKCPLNRCNAQYLELTLCGRSEPVFPSIVLDPIDNCSDSSFYIMSAAQELFQVYTDSLKGKFDSSYLAKCLDAYKYESFTVRHTVSEYHYTLYYYDQAGNLVKTVPPAGVRANYDSLWLDSVNIARLAGQVKVPAHELTSQYRYNTLNVVVARNSPDGGETNFWYDGVGRIALSRNAQQQSVSSAGKRFFGYTRYDELGRIREVGQVRDTSSLVINDTLTRNETFLNAWFTSLVKYRSQVNQTFYDTAYIGFGAGDNRLVVQQQHLRNRVSYTTYTDSPGVSAAYNQGTFYSYDIHGNVDTLLQDYGQAGSTPNMMARNGNRWKKMVYKYDLVSGKVNEVQYQPGWADQWLQRYVYDAGNKLIAAETSTDGVIWEKEAQYEYYLHGPLARTTIGAQQVQGIDFAYTLQGWLKGVNSVALKPNQDMGNDGLIGGLKQYVARDIYGFSLNYFAGDYFSISNMVSPFPGYMAYLPDSAYRPLYNGNITSMAESLDSVHIPGLAAGSTLFYNYKYDQLNRITRLDTYKGFSATNNSWIGLRLMGQYKERVSYDASGNILQYTRYGDKTGTGALMDNMQYHYYQQTNKLRYVTDNVVAGAYNTDVDNQVADNYMYDRVGNLVKDSAEGIKQIRWNVYGKIQEIIRNPNAANKVSKISYAYDGQGNQIGKTVERQGGAKEYTWYVRDAQSNIIAIYSDSSSATDLTALKPVLSERTIYGSSRLGTYNVRVDVDNGPADITHRDTSGGRRGLRFYELTNHLGNVLATITDRKYGVPVGTGDTISYYYVDVRSAQSYYPFGMVMPGRNAVSTECHEELQDNIEVVASSDLDNGAVQNGTDVNHNGVRWGPMTTTTTVSLDNQAIKVEGGGGSSDGVVAYLPGTAVEPNATYVFEFDIADKSAAISYFTCQAHTPGNDSYRAITRKTGLGHHTFVFTTPATLPDYIRLRISPNIVTPGTWFTVDNFVVRKFKVTDEVFELGTDFNSAVMSGVNVSSDGLLWSTINASTNSASLVGTADKSLKITCSNVNEAYLKTEMVLTPGQTYTLRFNMAQDALDKRLGVRFYARTGTVWAQTESQGLFYLGAGSYLFNFTHPAGADSARIEFIRSNNGNTYDGYNTPYTIDNFSINRLDTMGRRPVMICGGCHEEMVDLTELKVFSNLDSGVTSGGTNRFVHKGVTWQNQANGIVSVVNGAFRVENSGTSGSDGMLVVVPSSMIEPFTTYRMECDILEQSPEITGYNIQAISQTGDGYRVSILQAGIGHRAIVFTTGASVGNYVAFRISARPSTAGLYFIVDNFSFRKYTVVNQYQVHATNFNSAVMDGVNVNDNGQIWKPITSSVTSLALTGTTDKKIQVNCTNANDSRLMTDLPAEGGQPYLLKFTADQAQPDKRLFFQLSARTGTGPWTITDQRGIFYTGSGDFQFNFTMPAGADQMRIEFLRSNTGSGFDGLDVPYTIDNFSLQRMDVVASQSVIVCDSANGEGSGLYRYGFNGQEKSGEIAGTGYSYTASFWQYDARLGRRWNMDPIVKPYESPYATFANNPIWFTDYYGLDTSTNKSGVKEMEAVVVTAKRKPYVTGDARAPDWDKDDTKEFLNVDFNTDLYDKNNPYDHNSILDHMNRFRTFFGFGLVLESPEAQEEAWKLVNYFETGGGGIMPAFNTNSHMSKILSEDDQFVEMTEGFEAKLLEYLNKNGNLKGFDGSVALTEARMGKYIDDTWFMNTVMGGFKQVDSYIKVITADQVKIRYVVWDHFGGGVSDAASKLPGLPSLAWLQHNSTYNNPNFSDWFTPFIWGIVVERTIERKK